MSETAGNIPPGISEDLARVLRDAAPYLLSHRDRVAVVLLPGELFDNSLALGAWLHDMILLNRVAGMRFVIAYDALPQAATLAGDEAAAGFHHGMMAVDEQSMSHLHAAVMRNREQLEHLLAQGAPGNLEGVGTVVGNPLPAHAAGMVGEVNSGHMGKLKRVAPDKASKLVDTGSIVLLPPLGAGRDGERFHLDAATTALAFATACKADKLIVPTTAEIFSRFGFRELTLKQAANWLAQRGDATGREAELMRTGIAALEQGIDRVHFLDMEKNGGLLIELLSPDGVAAMLSRDPFDAVRMAVDADIAGIVELIAPEVEAGTILPRTDEQISERIGDYAVVARDEALIACAAMTRHGDAAEFNCLAVRPDYANQAYGRLLLDFFEQRARKDGIRLMLAATVTAKDWFTERGYSEADPASLPAERRASLAQRGNAVLAKQLD